MFSVPQCSLLCELKLKSCLCYEILLSSMTAHPSPCGKSGGQVAIVGKRSNTCLYVLIMDFSFYTVQRLVSHFGGPSPLGLPNTVICCRRTVTTVLRLLVLDFIARSNIALMADKSQLNVLEKM